MQQLRNLHSDRYAEGTLKSPHSLVRVFVVRMKKLCILCYPKWAIEGQIARLHKSTFLRMLWLILYFQQLSSALSSAGYLKSRCCKQCGPRSDCSFRSSLIWVHTVCLYAKCKFEKFARRCSRRHKQTTFSDADFLGALRVNMINLCSSVRNLHSDRYAEGTLKSPPSLIRVFVVHMKKLCILCYPKWAH